MTNEEWKRGWKHLSKSKPQYEGPYLCYIMDRETSETWYEVTYWTHHDDWETVYSKEFEQNVTISKKSKTLSFPNESFFVIQWVEIPGFNYSKGKR